MSVIHLGFETQNFKTGMLVTKQKDCCPPEIKKYIDTVMCS